MKGHSRIKKAFWTAPVVLCGTSLALLSSNLIGQVAGYFLVGHQTASR
jgi:hypothetical protein